MPEAHQADYSVAGGVVILGDRALLLEIASRGEFRLPKGHVREGESREHAALREVIEETGYVSPVVVECLGAVLNRFVLGEREVRRYETYFLMRLEDERTIARDPEDDARFTVRWSALSGAVELLTYESEREFLRRGIAYERSARGERRSP